MAKFADRLKEALQIRHMKQSELANITGINKSMISNYLSGRFEPKTENLNKLADALQVNDVWLSGLDLDKEEFWEKYLSDYAHADWMPHRTETLSEEEMDIITAYRDADDKIRTAIRTLLGVGM